MQLEGTEDKKTDLESRERKPCLQQQVARLRSMTSGPAGMRPQLRMLAEGELVYLAPSEQEVC